MACRWTRNIVWGVVLASGLAAQSPDPIVVGSKSFTESRILAEIVAQLIETRTDLAVERKLGLGGTQICFGALQRGAIDIYPEYTGTAWSALLGESERIGDPLRVFARVQARLRAEHGVIALQPFGFANSYALAMVEARAAELGVTRISDLVPLGSQLRVAVSHEFLERGDGYPGLAKAYGLSFPDLRGVEHGLVYEGLEAGEIDVIDAYTTDGKLLEYDLRMLEDDLRFFPPYQAIPLVRAEILAQHPELDGVLDQLAYALPEATIQRLNQKVESGQLDFAAAAAEFLRDSSIAPRVTPPRNTTLLAATLGRAGQHMKLTALAVLLAALFAIPLGIAIARNKALGSTVLGLAGMVQTIPSLALLALMIPFLGLSETAAIVALFLYAVLPILRNTRIGILEVDPSLVDAARGMGMRSGQILRLVELPLAVRTIMAGVRTAAVISVGFATLAAFIGAGGLGEPILTGLQLNDTELILWGAIPAAALALLVDFVLGGLEKWLAPRGTGS